MNFEGLQEEILKKSKDYTKNTSPYNVSVEETSGFISGVLWTLKKINKLQILKLDDENINEIELQIEKISPKENDIVVIKSKHILEIDELESFRTIANKLIEKNITVFSVLGDDLYLEMLRKDELELMKSKIDMALRNV